VFKILKTAPPSYPITATDIPEQNGTKGVSLIIPYRVKLPSFLSRLPQNRELAAEHRQTEEDCRRERGIVAMNRSGEYTPPLFCSPIPE
jgi:hypothetical protein